MVFLKLSDYKREGKIKLIKETKQKRQNKQRFPTEYKTKKPDKKFFITCPTGCSQDRTKSYRMSEKKTFDTRNNRCRNCNFYKSDEKVIHPVVFKTGNGKLL
jgi:hypothetical protein